MRLVSRPSHRPEPELLEVLAWIPVTARRGWRVARVRQDECEFAEIRSCSFDPGWAPSARDHRSVIRGPALARVIAALEAAEEKIKNGDAA